MTTLPYTAPHLMIANVYVSVCTDQTDEQAAAELNALEQYRTHLVPWVPSRSRTFGLGQPNPSPCDHKDRPGHRHVLFTVLREPDDFALVLSGVASPPGTFRPETPRTITLPLAEVTS